MGINTVPSISPGKSAKEEKSVGKSNSSGVMTRALFSDKCESDNTKSTMCFVFIMICCVLAPVLSLMLTAIRFKNSPVEVKQENKVKLLASIGLQIIIPILSGLLMYGAYDTCNALYAYGIGVFICMLNWLVSIFWLLGNFNGVW